MIDLARLHLARLLLVLGGACVRLVPWAAREVTVGRALLLLSGASAWLARRLVTPARGVRGTALASNRRIESARGQTSSAANKATTARDRPAYRI